MLDLYKVTVTLMLIESVCIGQEFNLNETSIISMLGRSPKANIVSFHPEGSDILLGLDFLMPFIHVPIVREIDQYGNEPALININAAALLSTGILSASSAFVSYLFRKYVIFEPKLKSEKKNRADNIFDSEIWKMLNNLKLVYKNSTGYKVDTSLHGLFTTIEETLQQNNIDLPACLQKALCHRLHNVTERSYDDNASGLDKIIDGLINIKWIQKNFLRYTSLNEIIGSRSHVQCDLKYSRCKLSSPMENIEDFVQTNLNFT